MTKNRYAQLAHSECSQLGAVKTETKGHGNFVKATFDRKVDAAACAELMLCFWWVEKSKALGLNVLIKVVP